MIHLDRYEMITSMSQVRLIDLYLSEVTSYITSCSKKENARLDNIWRHLTDITTVSSPLNFGMYLSPLVISDSLSGLNRHITFTQHSAASTIVYDFIQGNFLSGQQIWSSTPQSAEECINQTIKMSRRLPVGPFPLKEALKPKTTSDKINSWTPFQIARNISHKHLKWV